MEIILAYPKWYILLCLIAGGAYSLLLYFRENQLQEVHQVIKVSIAVFRGIVVAVLFFLLLEPLVKTETRTVEKPVIVIAQDNSESLLLSKDSSFYKGEYAAKIEELKTTLSEKYDVRTYSIGEELRENIEFTFTGKQSNLSALFGELYTRYYGRNLGAVIFATDGIYNSGANPLPAAKKLKGVPIYTIAMGDTTLRKDLVIADIAHNRLAYLGNEFPIEVLVDAKKCEGEKFTVKISSGGTTLAMQELNITSKAFTKVIPFRMEAKKTGMVRYTIELTNLEGELTYLNNKKDIFVEVLDSKQKILLLANSPHPDIGAIKNAITSNKNYEVTTKLVHEFDGDISKYSLIVLHQLPSVANTINSLTEKIYQAKIPVLYVLGSQSSITAFNALKTGLVFRSVKGTMNTVNGQLNRSFSLFTINENAARVVAKLPPLQVPFGEMDVTNAVQALFYQKVGTVETNFPLLFFNKEGDSKTGVITGEGIWRWKLKEYYDSENNDIVNEIIQKTVQFLAAKENKSFFRTFSKTDFTESEHVVIDAELYNESYELINEPEVSLIIKNEKGKDFSSQFSRTSNSYRVDAGKLPVGNYTYTATTKHNNKNLTSTGQFSVSPVFAEQITSVANHRLLYNLSAETKGEMVYPRETDKIADMISSKADIVEISYTHPRLSDLLNLKWIFFLLLSLLALEWFVRKRSGAY